MMARCIATFGLVLALCCGGVSAYAQDASTGTIAGWLRLAADKAKETRPVVLLSPYVAPAYSAFLPVWTVHKTYPDTGVDHYLDYAELGIGGKVEMSDKSYSAFVGFDVNLTGLSATLWDWPWAEKHIRRSKFPPIFVGPSLVAPLDYASIKTLTLKRDLRLMLSVAF